MASSSEESEESSIDLNLSCSVSSFQSEDEESDQHTQEGIIQPYEFEPEESSTESEQDSQDEDRLHNMNW